MSISDASAAKFDQSLERSIAEQMALNARSLFGVHPFAAELSKDQLARLLPEYLAMSQAFPYLQAGSQKDLVFDALRGNRDLPKDIELTSVVANFICWDEMGGHNLVLRGGNAALPNILDTENFHSKLFKRDMSRLLGREIRPNYGSATCRYLRALYEGLSSRDPIVRCAYMVAFELHAEEMIQELWTSLVKAFDVRFDDLDYFRVHVGGEDPAEKYHGEMTSRLIGRLVPGGSADRFLDVFRRAYLLNREWCRCLVRLGSLDGDCREEIEHSGRCHCGSVKFHVRAPADVRAVRCNCSICQMSGFLHLLVPHDKLKIECGEEVLTTYQFNTSIAQHTFCRICGVKPFYRPRSNPSGFSVNVQCLDRRTIASITIDEFDGHNWEKAMGSVVVNQIV